MEIKIDPTYVTPMNYKLTAHNQIAMLCPACGVVGVRLDRSDYYGDMIVFSCVNGHTFAWEFIETEASIVLFSVNVLADPTRLAIELAEKWKYDPEKRFVNDGGHKLASESQVLKLQILGGAHPDAFHELYLMICQYWGYKGFSAWSSNDAGFVIAWLMGKYGAFPPIARIGV